MHFKLIFTIFTCFVYSGIAQVGIGTSNPDASSVLDISSSSKGVLIPKVTLTSTTDNTTITSPAIGLLVYNTAEVSDITEGFYFWKDSKWNPIISGSGAESKWTNNVSLGGTTLITQSDGTTPRTATQNIFIKDDGKVGIGTSIPQGALQISTEGTDDVIITKLTNTSTNDVDLDFIKGEGSSSSPSVLTTTGTSLGGIRFRSFINPLTIISDPLSAFAPSAEIAAEVDNGTLSTTSAPGRLVFKTTSDGSINSLTRMTIKHDGNVIIGTSSTSDTKLSVEGMLRIDTKSGETGVPTHSAPAGSIIFQNNHFYGNTDGTPSGWAQLD